MKLRYISTALLATLFAGCTTFNKAKKVANEPEPKQDKPNIVVFLVDDMGWQDTSLPFWDKVTKLNKKYHTPNMERLAKEGVMFTNAYACAICSPSRVSLMTGMNAARHRVTNWTLRKDTMPISSKKGDLQVPVWNMNGIGLNKNLQHSVYTPNPLPKVLKNNGYTTIHVGKAHFGAIGTASANPLNMGFDVNIAGHAAGGPATYLGTDNFQAGKNSVWNIPGLEEFYGQDIFLTEALTQKALRTLDDVRKKKKPFFLYMAHYAVHVPIMGDKRFVHKYEESGLDPIEAKYASMIEGMDKSLGDIMDYLEKNNLEKNTVILFMSDNGGLSARGRGGKRGTHNLPLRSGKGSVYEGGIREPMIVKWPGVTKPNTKTNENIIIEDFYPTILEIANAKYESTPTQTIDGVSFVPILKTGKSAQPNRSLVWHYPNNWGIKGDGINFYSALREGDYKYIYFYDNRPAELYNTKTDIEEKNNLINQKPDLAKKMAKRLSDLLRERGAQVPTSKKTGEPIPFPDERIN